MTDWRSASPDMRFLAIDNYLADLNVLVDELGGYVDLIGLCQGGWLALTYAARFPLKVRKLVLAGAPIDVAAGTSRLSDSLTIHRWRYSTSWPISSAPFSAGMPWVLGSRSAQPRDHPCVAAVVEEVVLAGVSPPRSSLS